MPETWDEYLESKKKAAGFQEQARFQKTPAARLAFYYASFHPEWKIQADVIRNMDKEFEQQDLPRIRALTWSMNPIVADIAYAMEDEIIQRAAILKGTLKPEDHKNPWWSEEN